MKYSLIKLLILNVYSVLFFIGIILLFILGGLVISLDITETYNVTVEMLTNSSVLELIRFLMYITFITSIFVCQHAIDDKQVEWFKELININPWRSDNY